MGELNLTVITIVILAALVAFFTVVLWPQIKDSINNNWKNISESKLDTGYVVNVNNHLS